MVSRCAQFHVPSFTQLFVVAYTGIVCQYVPPGPGPGVTVGSISDHGLEATDLLKPDRVTTAGFISCGEKNSTSRTLTPSA